MSGRRSTFARFRLVQDFKQQSNNNKLFALNFAPSLQRRFGSIITYARSTAFIHIHIFFFSTHSTLFLLSYPAFCCIFLTFLLSQSQIVQTMGLAFPGARNRVVLCHTSFSLEKAHLITLVQQYLHTLLLPSLPSLIVI